MKFVLLPLLASLTASLGNVSIRLFQEKVQKNRRDLQVFQALYTFLSSLVFLFVSGFRFPGTTAGLLLTVAFAGCLLASTIGLAQSYLCGPMSLSGVIISCSVVMPVAFGCLAYGEVLTLTRLLGIGFLLAAFIVTGAGSGEGKKEITFRWILWVMVSFLGSGFGAIVLAVYSRLPETGTNNGFMAISFFVEACMLSLGVLFARRPGEKARVTAPFFGLAGLSALGCFGTNLLVIYLSGIMPASLLHPVYNGAAATVVTIVSCLAFRERMSRKKLAIILLGICAIVFLNL